MCIWPLLQLISLLVMLLVLAFRLLHWHFFKIVPVGLCNLRRFATQSRDVCLDESDKAAPSWWHFPKYIYLSFSTGWEDQCKGYFTDTSSDKSIKLRPIWVWIVVKVFVFIVVTVIVVVFLIIIVHIIEVVIIVTMTGDSFQHLTKSTSSIRSCESFESKPP